MLELFSCVLTQQNGKLFSLAFWKISDLDTSYSIYVNNDKSICAKQKRLLLENLQGMHTGISHMLWQS